VSEWLFGLLLFLGFWHKRLGILGALGSCASFIGTVTIIPFMPGGWAASAGGFPAMTGNVPFLMKEVVLFAVSVYLLKQDVARVARSAPKSEAVLEGSRPEGDAMKPTVTLARKAREGSLTPDDPRVPVRMTVNGGVRKMTEEPRTSLLDALRDGLGLTGTKKACDRGECGARTVDVDGRRIA